MNTDVFDSYEKKEEVKKFIKTITDVNCKAVIDNEYLLRIKTKRQENNYLYKLGDKFVSEYYDKKIYYLTDETFNVIQSEIEKMNKYVKTNSDKNTINIKEFDVVINYVRNDTFYYDIILKCNDLKDGNVVKVIRKINNIHIFDFLNKLSWIVCETDIKLDDEFNYEDVKTKLKLSDDLDERTLNQKVIFYIRLFENVNKNKDLILKSQLNLYYGIENNNDIEYLSKLTNIKLLPTLNINYNKDYYVDTETIDFDLLKNSNYSISHKAYFAMQNSTRKYYTLNPYSKKGVDAAPINCKFISFEEYLKLF